MCSYVHIRTHTRHTHTHACMHVRALALLQGQPSYVVKDIPKALDTCITCDVKDIPKALDTLVVKDIPKAFIRASPVGIGTAQVCL